MLSNRCLHKFESYMMGKTGVWHLRKNLVLFGPPDMQKTQELPVFLGQHLFCSTLLDSLIDPPILAKVNPAQIRFFNNLSTVLL